MEPRRRSSIVTSFKCTPADNSIRRRSCTLVDDIHAFKRTQHGRNPHAGDQISSSLMSDNRGKGSLPLIMSDGMLFNPTLKKSNSTQFSSVYCPPSRDRVFPRRRSCTVIDSVMQSKQKRNLPVRRQSYTFENSTIASALLSSQPKESRRYISSSVISGTKSSKSMFLSPREKLINKRRQSCPVNEIVIRTDADGVVSVQQQMVQSPDQMFSQRASNQKLNQTYVYDRTTSQSKHSLGDRGSQSSFREMGIHGSRRVVLTERVKSSSDTKCGTTLPKSQSFPYKMASSISLNRERLHGTSDYDQDSYSSLYDKISPEEQKILKSHSSARLGDDIASRDARSESELNNTKSQTTLHHQMNEQVPNHCDESPPCKQRKNCSTNSTALSNQHGSGCTDQSHASTQNEAGCTNEPHSLLQRTDRNEPMVWKQLLKTVNESADDDNDAELQSTRKGGVPIAVEIVRMPALKNNGIATACSGIDSTYTQSAESERNVHIFLSSSKLKEKHKTDKDTVLISFCVSPACITFSVLQLNYISARMRGGVPFAKVLIMDSRLNHCSENYYRHNSFIVNLGQEAHFCFSDLLSLELMSLNIEMCQQQGGKEKCLGFVEIKLSEQEKLTDVILWKTLQKPIRQSKWGNIFSCFSRRKSRETL